MIAASLTMDYERSQVIGFSVPFKIDDLSFIMPYPELDHMGTIDGITRPFQYKVLLVVWDWIFSPLIYMLYQVFVFFVSIEQVWILIVVSIATVAIFLWKILSSKLSLT